MIQLAPKDVNDKVDYLVNVSGITGDPIQSVEILPTGITIDVSPAPSFTASTVTFRVSGGTAGTFATIRLTVTTTAGRVIRRFFSIPIQSL